MFEALQAPLFFGLIAAFVTTLGLLAVALRSDWSLRYANLFVATGPLMAPLKDVKPAHGLTALSAGVVIAVGLLFAPIPGHEHNHGAHEHHDHDHGPHAVTPLNAEPS